MKLKASLAPLVSLNTNLTHCGRVTQICVFNTVKLGISATATPQGGMFPEVSHPQALLGSLMSISENFSSQK
jgi:hypothetical protein